MVRSNQTTPLKHLQKDAYLVVVNAGVGEAIADHGVPLRLYGGVRIRIVHRTGTRCSTLGNDLESRRKVWHYLALQTIDHPEFTHAFVGQDLRKVSTEDPAVLLDAAGSEIGIVLTCATDMGIGRYDGRIVSIAGPDKPKNFKPKGLSCGFVKVKTRLSMGDTIELKDKRRKITVTVVDDVRSDRTARCAMRDMI